MIRASSTPYTTSAIQNSQKESTLHITMLPTILYPPSVIELEFLEHVLYFEEKTFQAVELVLDGLVDYEKGDRDSLFAELRDSGNCYFYFILWYLRNNRDVRHFWKVYKDAFYNMRYRFVVLDITSHYDLEDVRGLLCVQESVTVKSPHWCHSISEAFTMIEQCAFNGTVTTTIAPQ